MENSGVKQRNLVQSIWLEKCPHCGQGQVFEKKQKWYDIMPAMKHECEYCHYKFDREPGYFLGAMYISYALAVALAIAVFCTMYFLFPSLNVAWIIGAIATAILLFSQKNFRISRIIYIHLFSW